LKLSDIDRRFEFPLTLALSKWGELYVLEETSSIVIKIETASNLSTFFGGYKPGAENLNGAKKAALDEEGNLYFALPQVDCISVFDRYGNFMGQRPLGFKVIAIESDGKFLWCSDGKEIKCLYDHQFLDIAFADERNRLQANIIDIAAGNGNLILLSSDAPYIHIYQLSTSPSSIVW
jgi:hypothetical protein